MKKEARCVVYHTAVGNPWCQIAFDCNPDIVRFECVCENAYLATRKILELEKKYAPEPKHMSGYHYVSAKDWCEYWQRQRTEGHQLKLI